jgi:hypothetical protein
MLQQTSYKMEIQHHKMHSDKMLPSTKVSFFNLGSLKEVARVVDAMNDTVLDIKINKVVCSGKKTK